jgi:hypothetical protein
MTDETPTHRFLTDEEVAERLRCTVRGVRRLRLLGRLRYVPGRPPHVDVADLEAYIEEAKQRATPPDPPRKRQPGDPWTEADDAEIKRRIRRKALRRRMRASRG